jgi:hypothetical protein
MPIQYTIDPKDGRMLTRADGMVRFHDIVAHLDVEESNRDLSRAELIDARDAVTDLTADQVRLLVQRAAKVLATAGVGPTAIVTTNDLVFGMARMYALLADGVGVNAEVFRDIRSATDWLGSFEA